MKRSFLASLLLVFASLLHCNKENNIDQSTNTTVGDVCGPKVACADGTCSFGFCRSACKDDSDCANSGVCLSDGTTKTCRLPLEGKCSASAPCPAGLLCGADASCRTPCDATRPCDIEGQSCQQGACVTLAGGGGSGGTSGMGGSSGASGEAGGGASGEAGSSGAAGKGTGGSSAGKGGNAGDAGSAGEGGAGGDAGAGGATICDPVLGEACCAEAKCGTTEGMVCTDGKCACDLGASDCDSNAENGCEANLLADGKNCGKCGHDCGGGACTAGQCQPFVVVPGGAKDGEAQVPTGYQGLMDFVPFDEEGFVLPVIVPATGKLQLRAFDIDGKPGDILTSEENGINLQAGPFVTPSGVFWSDGTSVKRVARTGGTVTTPVPFACYEIHVADGSLYVRTDAAIPKIARVPKGSLTVETIYPAVGQGNMIFAANGSDLFWAAGSLSQGDLLGTAPQTKYAAFVPSECNYTTTLSIGLQATADAVFGWASWCPSAGNSTIFKYDRKTGNQSTVLPVAPENSQINWVVADGDDLFYLSNPKIRHIETTGGPVTDLATSPGSFHGLRLSGAYLYTWKLSAGPGDPGGMARIARP